jgi:hypothetical protein
MLDCAVGVRDWAASLLTIALDGKETLFPVGYTTVNGGLLSRPRTPPGDAEADEAGDR